ERDPTLALGALFRHPGPHAGRILVGGDFEESHLRHSRVTDTCDFPDYRRRWEEAGRTELPDQAGLRGRVPLMAGPLAEIADSFFTPAVNDLVPYEPGKPVEEVQRELGLERVVKLASNEGPYGPFPEALEAMARAASELNRYPEGGAHRLRAALAERLDLRFEEVAPGAGSDGLVDCLSQASLQPGDEIICGWPSFPSYVIDARKLGATPRTIPLKNGRYDLDAMLDAVGPRTKIVYVCHPNNPTGTTNTRAELDAYFERVPDHVLTVLDQAYFEYIDDPDYPD